VPLQRIAPARLSHTAASLRSAASNGATVWLVAIRRSDLDWMSLVCRCSPTGHPAVGYVGSPDIRLFWLSRSVLTDFLVGQLSDDTWVRKAPVIFRWSKPE
jgi:hypothetical protein